LVVPRSHELASQPRRRPAFPHQKTFSRSTEKFVVMSKKVLLLVVLVIAVAIAWKMVVSE
jgi:septal ring-binding cell division protein DamX